MTRRQKSDDAGRKPGSSRDQRLKEALRANLRRRKDQARARKPGDKADTAGKGQD